QTMLHCLILLCICLACLMDFHYNTNISHLTSSNVSRHNRLQNQLSSHAGVLHGDHSILLNNILQHQYPKWVITITTAIPTTTERSPCFSTITSHLSALQSQIFNTFPSPAHLSKYGLAHKRESKPKSAQKGKHSVRFSHQGSDAGSHKSDSNLPQFRSKYMTGEEIESILRMQHAATHGNDPYVDDILLQGHLAKDNHVKQGQNIVFATFPSRLEELG
ncbi:UNVERIFIED_CONTAM: protein PAT12, partial [Sesamum angustifolium]